MRAEKILALVLSIICWSACRTLSRMRERGDKMSGAAATTLKSHRERTPLVQAEALNFPSSNLGSTHFFQCLRRMRSSVAIMDPSRRQGTDMGVVSWKETQVTRRKTISHLETKFNVRTPYSSFSSIQDIHEKLQLGCVLC